MIQVLCISILKSFQVLKEQRLIKSELLEDVKSKTNKPKVKAST